MDAASDGRFDRPVFIISTPRSGSTLLFETLAQAPGLFTIGHESHRFIEGLQPFTPAEHGWSSNRLTAEDARHPAVKLMTAAFYDHLKDRDGRRAEGRVRMLEKTPKNALRLPFIETIWPDALFVYLHRDPRQTLASMMRAWQSGKFKTYSNLPGWTGLPWSLVLVPGWERYIGAPLQEIVAHQWATATTIILDDLSNLPSDRRCAIDYNDFLAAPQQAMETLSERLDIGWDRRLPEILPASRMTLTVPDVNKWRELEPEIEQVWPSVAPVAERARACFDRWRNS